MGLMKELFLEEQQRALNEAPVNIPSQEPQCTIMLFVNDSLYQLDVKPKPAALLLADLMPILSEHFSEDYTYIPFDLELVEHTLNPNKDIWNIIQTEGDKKTIVASFTVYYPTNIIQLD